MNKLLCTLAFLLATICVSAQYGTLKGIIVTSDDNPAESVAVIVKGTGKGTLTDKEGHYEITNLKAGFYTLEASITGLKSRLQKVAVNEGETITADFTLEENNTQLQTVLVTSNPSKYVTDYPSISLRLKTPLLQLPQNIQVVTRQTLVDQQVFDMRESVIRNVSGATASEHWETYARIVMRGSRIAAFRNGMNVQETWGPLTEDMSMVERIEFVKGPAGFMLASGEPSGFYNVVTKKPTGITKGEAGMTVGSFGTYRSTVDLDGLLSKDGRLQYRLNVMGQTKGTQRNFEYNNRVSIAPVLKYQVDSNTSITAEYTYQHVNMSPIGSGYAFSPNKTGDLPVGFSTLEDNMNPTNITDQSLFITLSHSLNANWKLTGQLAYLHYDQVGTSLWASGFREDTLQRTLSIWDIVGQTRVGQFFVNGDVVTGTVKHRILSGIDMGDKDFYHDFTQGGAITGVAGFNVYHPVYGTVPASGYPVFDRSLGVKQRGKHYSNKYSAIYLQDEIRMLNEKLRLTLAGRYTTTGDANPYSGTTDAKKFTPRVGLSYSINDATSIYAVYDESFIPQAGATYTGINFKPVIGNNKEIGIKREWLHGRVTASAAAYQITKNNELAPDPEHQYFNLQFGQTKTRGVELDIRGKIIAGLEATLNYAYTDARVTEDTENKQVDKQIPGTDKHIANTWLSYQIPTGIMRGLGLSFGVAHAAGRTSWYGAYDRTVDPAMPNYTRFDAAASYRIGKFGVALNVNNLFNAKLLTGGYYSWSNFYYWQSEAPRNSRLSITYKF